MALRVALLVLLVGCKTTHTLEAYEDVKLSDVEHSEASGEKHEGPVTITTTVEEYAPSIVQAPLAGTGAGLENVAPPSSAVGPGVPPTGLLVKRTVTVEQHGVIDETWQASGNGVIGAETHATVKSEDKTTPAGGCMLGLGFYGALAIAGLCLAGGLYLKWRR